MNEKETGFDLSQEYFYMKLILPDQLLIMYTPNIEDQVKELFSFLEVRFLSETPDISDIVNGFGSRHENVRSYKLTITEREFEWIEDVMKSAANKSILSSLDKNDN